MSDRPLLCMHDRIESNATWQNLTLIKNVETCLDCGARRASVPCPTCGTHVDERKVPKELPADAEVVVNVDSFGVWTMKKDDEVPVLRYPTAEDGKTITVSPDPSLYEYGRREGWADPSGDVTPEAVASSRAMLDDCTTKKDCSATIHLKDCKSQKKRIRRLGG